MDMGLSLDVTAGQEDQEVPELPDDGLGPDDLTELNRRIGEGAGGTVTLCENAKTGEILAKKSVLIMDELKMKEIRREVSALRRHKCQYLITFHGAYYDSIACSVNFILEYMDVGSLQDIVKYHQKRSEFISESILSHMFWQALQGLKYIHHTLKTIHRDLKPGNLLINSHGEVKVTDFGVSRELESSANSAETYVGTLVFMAPEMVQKSRMYSNKVDIWAMGITAMEMATLKHPFKGEGETGFISYFTKVQQETPKLTGSEHSDDLKEFVGMCLAHSPHDRADCAGLLSTPWIQKVVSASASSPDSFRSTYMTWLKSVHDGIRVASDESNETPAWFDAEGLDALANN